MGRARDSEPKPCELREFIFPFFLLPPLWPPSLASFSSTEEYPPPPTVTATLPTGTQTDQPQEMLTRSSSWVRLTFLDRQPSLGRRHRGTGSWCPGSRCSWSHHPRCPQWRPTEPGLQHLWKEEKASQLWRKHLPWRSWSWRTRPRRGGAVLLAHRPGVHLQQWQEAEASTWRG